jgi:orotate phosphoribosyltransferase
LSLSNGRKVYEEVVNLAHSWNNQCMECVDHHSIGLVVGATDNEAMKAIRSLAPNIWILCPGVGSQSGDLTNACLNGLRPSDCSGMLISVSRGIAGATDITAAAMMYRDDINYARQLLLSSQIPVNIDTNSDTSGNSNSNVVSDKAKLLQYQKDFIRLCIDANVLQFGQFTLKSGRSSPYFFNAGNFCNGLHIRTLGRCYSEAIHRSGVQFEVLFGPAYKGIPIAAAIAIGYYDMYGVSVDVAYNRKEVKDHGEGGSLVGCNVNGRRVLVVDDVITAGTAIKEAMAILSSANAIVVGVTVCLDRQESGSNVDKPEQSAIQQVEEEFSIPVVSIIKFTHLLSYVETDCEDQSIVEAMKNVAVTHKIVN